MMLKSEPIGTDPQMFVEQRVYTLRPGATSAFLQYYAENGRIVQIAHLGEPIGYYFSEIGPLNRMVMTWFYNTLDERTQKRQALASNPDWIAYLAHARQMVTAQETSILRPAPFFADRLRAYIQTGGTDE